MSTTYDQQEQLTGCTREEWPKRDGVDLEPMFTPTTPLDKQKLIDKQKLSDSDSDTVKPKPMTPLDMQKLSDPNGVAWQLTYHDANINRWVIDGFYRSMASALGGAEVLLSAGISGEHIKVLPVTDAYGLTMNPAWDTTPTAIEPDK